MSEKEDAPVFENPIWEKARKALAAVSPQKNDKSKEDGQNNNADLNDGVAKRSHTDKEDGYYNNNNNQFNNFKNYQGPPRPQ